MRPLEGHLLYSAPLQQPGLLSGEATVRGSGEGRKQTGGGHHLELGGVWSQIPLSLEAGVWVATGGNRGLSARDNTQGSQRGSAGRTSATCPGLRIPRRAQWLGAQTQEAQPNLGLDPSFSIYLWWKLELFPFPL